MNKRLQQAKQYVGYKGILPQAEGECDNTFVERVAGDLRDLNMIIEAHEVQAGHRYDDPDQKDNPLGAMAGIMGAMALALNDGPRGSSGSNQVGLEMAAGGIVAFENSPEGHRKRQADEAMATMFRAGVDPDVFLT